MVNRTLDGFFMSVMLVSFGEPTPWIGVLN